MTGAVRPRVGLLGTGPWAWRTHAPALAAHPGVELAGVWGRRPEAAGRLAAEFGTRAYGDADALIADVDAVAIALPPSFQARFAVRAARAGRHLLLDKPLAATVEDARAVADAVDAAGVASVVFFTLRFDAATGEWIGRQAATGGWFTGRADWYGAVFGDADRASPYADSPWRREKGGLWDVGPHALSVLLPVLGDVTRVDAARGPADTVHLTLRHAETEMEAEAGAEAGAGAGARKAGSGGASSTAVLTLSAPPAGAGVAVEFRGAHGIARLPDNFAGPAADAFGRAVDALLAGPGHPCDARFGLRVTEILAAAEAALG